MSKANSKERMGTNVKSLGAAAACATVILCRISVHVSSCVAWAFLLDVKPPVTEVLSGVQFCALVLSLSWRH